MSSRDWLPYRAIARGGLIVLATLLISAAGNGGQPVSASTNHAPQQNNKKTENAAAIPQPSPPVIIEVQPSAKEIETAAKQEAAEGRILGLQPDDWVAVFTLLLFLSTGLLWGATYKAARIAERVLTELERPWIFVDLQGGISPPDGKYGLNYLTFDTKNFGRAPGIIEKVVCGIRDVATSRFQVFEIASPNVMGPDKVIPDGHFLIDPKYPIIRVQATRTTTELPVNNLVFFMEITYSDVGGNNHVSRFTWSYNEENEHWERYGGVKENFLT